MASDTVTTNRFSLALLLKFGYVREVVEQWVPCRGKKFQLRKDFLGFADILAIKAATITDLFRYTELEGRPFNLSGALAVQTTSGNCGPDHIRKVTEGEPKDALETWLACGNRFEIWAWRPLKGAKGTLPKLVPKITRIVLEKTKAGAYTGGFELMKQSELELSGWVPGE